MWDEDMDIPAFLLVQTNHTVLTPGSEQVSKWIHSLGSGSKVGLELFNLAIDSPSFARTVTYGNTYQQEELNELYKRISSSIDESDEEWRYRLAFILTARSKGTLISC